MHGYTIAALFGCLIFCLTCHITSAVPTPPTVVLRARRSFAPSPPNQPGNNQDGRGNVNVDIQRERGGGTVVSGNAQGNVYRSPDGNTRVDAHGHWERTYHGSNHGQRNHGGGIRFSHRW